MSANSVALAYLVAAVLFILTLKNLSSPVSALRGNLFGMTGMLLAVLTTLAKPETHNMPYILIAIAIGGTIGAIVAKRIQMTQMPELVAAMHSLVGLAAVLIAMAAFNNPLAYGIGETLHASNRIELFIGTFVGAITFTGSIIAFGKLSGKLSGKPLRFAGQHWLNLGLGIAMIAFGIAFYITPSWTPFLIMRRRACDHLQEALARYGQLGAAPFHERCAAELAACGLHPVRRGAGPDATIPPLTARERAVAGLAVRGLTNREIAAELVISVKTVERHLGTIFVKLGVSNRTQLAAQLGGGREPVLGRS